MDWQPIETAPKDADELFLWLPDLGARPAVFFKGKWESPVDEMTKYTDATHWAFPPEGPSALTSAK